ncbi:MAG: hypothetical protein LDL41_10605 [Coleofasciculus sp. S288]|nr:hypothetical protein [Coleofasciculus sp. S288]
MGYVEGKGGFCTGFAGGMRGGKGGFCTGFAGGMRGGKGRFCTGFAGGMCEGKGGFCMGFAGGITELVPKPAPTVYLAFLLIFGRYYLKIFGIFTISFRNQLFQNDL